MESGGHVNGEDCHLTPNRVAATVTEESLNNHSLLYPGLQDIRELSVQIALDISDHFYENNLATLHPEPEDKEMFIRQQIYDYT
ncbi:hypothetical protein COOONC_25987, partial [Cooperia oncophora]